MQPKFPPWGLAMPSKATFEQDQSVLTTWSKTPVVTNSTGYVPKRINPTPEYRRPGHNAPKRASAAGINHQE